MSIEPDKGLKVVGWQKDGDDSFDRDVIIFDDGSLWKHDGNEWYRIWQPDFEPSEPTVDDPEPENIPRQCLVSTNPKFRNPYDVQRIAELEARIAELGAMGGVAWALKRRLGGDLNRNSQNSVILYESRKDAEKVAPNSGVTWDAVPYPIGSAADAIKTANERAEIAEARVKELEAELAAAKSEPVKLDSVRVMRTAASIAFHRGSPGVSALGKNCIWKSLYYAALSVLHAEGWNEALPYELAE